MLTKIILKNDSNICLNNYFKTHPRPVAHICRNCQKMLNNGPLPHLHNILDLGHRHCIVHRQQHNVNMIFLNYRIKCIRIYHQSIYFLLNPIFISNVKLTFITSSTCYLTVFLDPFFPGIDGRAFGLVNCAVIPLIFAH